jgi:ubiquinone/menaquinone biosynthesis C-methylase UbiE
MNKLRLYTKVVLLFLSRKLVTAKDIGQSYNQVSNSYTDRFLSTMHRYNDEMIRELANNLNKDQNSNQDKYRDALKVLDLAAGTGYNSSTLSKIFPTAELTLVDISTAMLNIAEKHLQQNAIPATFVAEDMLSFLKSSAAETFDIVICAWALKYQSPLQIIRHCHRVLKPGGFLSVIVNKKNTLPQVAKIYPKLLERHTDKISKLMLPLPNPRNLAVFDNWFLKNSFSKVVSKEGSHDFTFNTSRELVDFVTSTGALAGFDVMLDLRHPAVQSDMIQLMQKNHLTTASHRYIYGIYKKN